MFVRELLEKTGISRDTLRFYEKAGLLDSFVTSRAANGYRDYPQTAVDRLKLVRLAKDLGFSLREIVDLVSRWEQGQFSKEEKIRLFSDKIAQIEVKKTELEVMRAFLEDKIAMIQASP